MTINPYQILKVHQNANPEEIKKAYRELVKIHHPDTGGDTKVMLEINAAWELLKKKNKNLQGVKNSSNYSQDHLKYEYKKKKNNLTETEEIKDWFRYIYLPIDKLLGQIINPLPSKIRELSADPYDEVLMESFCSYIDQSKHKIEKVQKIYKSNACPSIAKQFSLDLYYCLSQVEDGLNELERYSMGYVDNYLHDGKSMIIEAKKKRKSLKNYKKEFVFL